MHIYIMKLNMVVNDMKAKGISPIYLVTDHIGFYEKYGWEFLCMVQGDGEPNITRMYIHPVSSVLESLSDHDKPKFASTVDSNGSFTKTTTKTPIPIIAISFITSRSANCSFCL